MSENNIEETIPEHITEEDEKNFFEVVTNELTQEQIDIILNPEEIFPRMDVLLAVHWHPEQVPMDLILKRIDTLYPNRVQELVIPTQHNTIMSCDGYCGVEIDCYSRGFDSKVQLLVHFAKDKLEKATMLKSMISYTFKYRYNQLFDYMHAVVEPAGKIIDNAARETGADDELIHFVRVYMKKLHGMLDTHADKVPPFSLKNKLVNDFFHNYRLVYGNRTINRALAFLKEVKTLVKSEFPMHHFYRTSEIIEEARGIGAGIIIPHPEQFWPILLADYDVDGLEIWNPQSRKYSDFLISVVHNKNRSAPAARRKLLVFMGDDAHIGEKIRPAEIRSEKKAAREIGVQHGWDDPDIRKKLILLNLDKSQVINEYKERLQG